MPKYRPRWRTDASGYVARFAGQWASKQSWTDRGELEQIVRATPNGDHIDLIEV